MELFDKLRRCKRLADPFISTKKAFLIVAIVFGLLLYLGPSVFRWLLQKTPILIDTNVGCVSQYLDPLYRESLKYDAHILKSYDKNENDFLPYIGNGKVALPLNDDGQLHILYKRALTLPIPFQPIVFVDLPGAVSQEGIGIHYTTGMAYKFKCFKQRRNTVEMRQEIYAHRLYPSLVIQNIRVKNPLNEAQTVILQQTGIVTTSVLNQKSFKTSKDLLYNVKSFKVLVPETQKYVLLTIASPHVPDSLTVDAKSFSDLLIISSVHYLESFTNENIKSSIQKLEQSAQEDIRKAFSTERNLKQTHIQVWQQLWRTGFGISESKAQGIVNGDKINATLYYVLSNARAYLSEDNFSMINKRELQTLLAYPDKCYSGLHTIQAPKLWSHLTTIEDVNKIVALWMLTLEKQGCQKLLKAGAEGVIQAMTLSFGALRFSNDHLEFNTHPKDLHRDYYFRRVSYGNATHLNITVTISVDNKALLQVAVDRSDKDYYGCDGGCLDPPVKLSSELTQFPVKLTEPVTAVLYITSDKEHMEALKHTIHVKEVQEAPAHEHHIIALHRHGHQLGGLPALFWVSIAFLIVVFHLFLAKLVYNEYCGGSQKTRGRYIV